MKRILIAVIALMPTVAFADPAAPLTVEQCINILAGLNSLTWAGQQLGETPDKKPPDAKQYKLGDVRVTIAFDIESLQPVLTSYQRASQQFLGELPPVPQADAGKPQSPAAIELQADNNKKFIAFQVKALGQPCPVTINGRLKLSDLKLGDGADQNQIPVNVLAAIVPIIDK